TVHEGRITCGRIRRPMRKYLALRAQGEEPWEAASAVMGQASVCKADKDITHARVCFEAAVRTACLLRLEYEPTTNETLLKWREWVQAGGGAKQTLGRWRRIAGDIQTAMSERPDTKLLQSRLPELPDALVGCAVLEHLLAQIEDTACAIIAEISP